MTEAGMRPTSRRRTRRPLPNVILLSSVDPNWDAASLADSGENEQRMLAGFRGQGHTAELVRVQAPREIPGSLRRFDPEDWIVFNWCESFAGISNGYWLAPPLLERLGFTYTGASTTGLKATQSKTRTMRMLGREGVPVPEWKVFKTAEQVHWDRFPAIVKPAEEHSSFGITPESVVYSEEAARARVAQLIEQYPQPMIISDFLNGREFNVAIWGNGLPEVLPIHELDFSAFTDERERICSFDAKWVPGTRAWDNMPSLCPAPVRGRLKRRIEEVALAAYQIMGCRDYGRVDMRERDGEVYVIDVNANCDITTSGGFARSARVAGYDYGAAVSRIVAIAMARRDAEREAYERAFDHELTVLHDWDMGVLTAV